MPTPKQIIVFCAIAFLVTACRQRTNQNGQPASGNRGGEAKPATIRTPNDALTELQNGNRRFLENRPIHTNYKQEIEETKTDQHPHSVILSCLDSRIPPEIIFDQGIGNIFVARVAGNIEDANILGSMEFATKIKGARLIVVMGHNNCGAVKGAIDNAKLGNLTQLVEQIKPAISADTSDPAQLLTKTVQKNVENTITDIITKSPVIHDLVNKGEVKIVGAIYDLNTGMVHFL